MRVVEASREIDGLLAELAKGDSLEIRRGNQPVAFVYAAVHFDHPERSAEEQERIAKAIDGFREIQQRSTLGGMSLKSLIEEGRR